MLKCGKQEQEAVAGGVYSLSFLLPRSYGDSLNHIVDLVHCTPH